MKILLVYAAYYDTSVYKNEKKRVFWEPLGIAYLKGYLKREGYDVDILYPVIEGFSKDDVKEYLRNNVKKYDFIGLSSPNFMINNVSDFVNIIRDSGYVGKIELGGLGPTCTWEKFLDSGVDFIIIGEGEKTILKLVQAIENGSDINSISGIAYIDENGRKVRNGNVELIENLDDNAFPARDTILRISENIDKNHIHIQIQSSRGCYGNCSFCSMSRFLKAQGESIYRSRSAKNVVDEIEMLNKTYGFKCFDFMDENFFPSNKRDALNKAKEFVNEIKSRKLEIEIFIQCQLQVITTEMLDLLYEVNVNSIFVGMDSFDEKTLRIYNKPYSMVEVDNFMEIVKNSKYGFEVDAPYRIKFGFINFSPLSDFNSLKKVVYNFKNYGMTCKKMLTKLRIDDEKSPVAQKVLNEFPKYTEDNYFKEEDVALFYKYIMIYYNEVIKIRNEIRNLEITLDKDVPNVSEKDKCKGFRKWIDNNLFECYEKMIELIESGKKDSLENYVERKITEFNNKYNQVRKFVEECTTTYVDYDFLNNQSMHTR